MSLIASALKHMLAAGMPREAIIAAVEDMEATLKPTKTARAERNARYYDAHKDELRLKASEKRLNGLKASEQDARVSSSVPKEKIPRTPLKEITLNSTIPTNMQGASARDFADFWELYPHKVGKGIAEKSFLVARRRADQPTLIAGLHRYIESKPPDRDWCNPSTWLNQQRWLDAPANPQSNRRDNRNERPGNILDAFDRLKARVDSSRDPSSFRVERNDEPSERSGLPLLARGNF